MTVKELREQAANLIEQARALQHKAEEEKRDLTDEESANFDRYIDDAEALEAKAEKAEADKARRSRLADVADRFADHRSRPRTQHDDISRVEPATPDREEVIRRGWETALRYHPDNLTTEQRGYISEARALQADLDVSGGYLTAPPQFNAQLIEAVRNDIVIGGLATQMTIPTNEVVQWPVLDTRPDNPDVRGEIETITADSGTAFGLREFTPVKYAKSVVISDKLTSIAGLDIDSLMIDLYRYEFADTFDAAFATGTGANAPLGLFTAATNGISTSRDVNTGNSTTAFTLDGLINALYSGSLAVPPRRGEAPGEAQGRRGSLPVDAERPRGSAFDAARFAGSHERERTEHVHYGPVRRHGCRLLEVLRLQRPRLRCRVQAVRRVPRRHGPRFDRAARHPGADVRRCGACPRRGVRSRDTGVREQ